MTPRDRESKQPILQVRGLSKRFRRRLVVNDLSLAVYPGDIYGFLGPNGAGKTTTMRMIVGLVRPNSGAVVIAGDRLRFWRRRLLARVGAVVEAPSFYGFLSGRDNLRLFADLTGKCSSKRIEATLERVGLRDRAGDRVADYSQGMKQRLAVAAALLPWPELIVLDEPTSGLDPMGIRNMRDLMRRLVREDGLTVFFSSHLLSEVEQVCNRGAIMVEGHKIWEGQIADLLSARRRIRLRVGPVERAHKVLGELAELGATVTTADSGDPEVLYIRGLAIDPEVVVAQLVHAGCQVGEVISEVPGLEEVFLELVRGETTS